MSLHSDAVESLTRLGFNGTDARLYLALLNESPATGYDLSSRSGVPRSAVYGALSRLEQAGLISQLPGKPARYLPLPPRELMRRLTTDFRENSSRLEGLLETLQSARPAPATFTVAGYDSLLDQARSLVDESQRSVFGSLWAREAVQLDDNLHRAHCRDVDVVLFSFTPLSPRVGRVLSYGIAEAELERHWSHKLILVSDQRRALIGSAEPGAQNRAVLTEEPSLVEMAVSNVVLDITLLGQKQHVEVDDVVQRLTAALAPVEALGR